MCDVVDPGRSARHEQWRERDIELLRQRWDDGKASGRAGPLDIIRIIAEECARLDSDVKGRPIAAP